ncbi:MAG: glycosyltransferase family 2 protein [Gammaproteobacteria bacterium]
MRYDVSIIVINFHSSTHTLACVDSIFKHCANVELKFNIVIVDNDSEGSDYEKLLPLKAYDNIEIVRSRVNLGFSAGHMFGIQFTQARFYFFLNNDCRFLNDCLTPLYTFCCEHGNAGVCSPQNYAQDGGIQPTFGYFPTLSSQLLGAGLLRLFKPEKYPRKKAEYASPLKVDMVQGSALFVRAEAFHRIGGFDTTFFLYCEEEDLSLRLSKLGYATYLVPEAHNFHYGGGSTREVYPAKKEFFISFLYFYRKHYGLLKTQILRLFLFAKHLRRSARAAMNFKLAFFILSGAHLKHSLRHQQKMSF